MQIYSLKKQAVMMAFLIGCSAWAVPHKPATTLPEGDRLLYTRLVESYRRGNLMEVNHQRRLLEKNYPKSIHLDNAYYLSGMLEYQHNHLGEALKHFDQITRKMVKSGKRPAAMFAKAMTYQKLKLAPQSHQLLVRVMKEYPGSPESRRAWMHLKLEKASAVQ